MTKLLIVEDDISIQKMIAELLQRHGFSVDCAYSGTEALLLLEREVYDLILLDLVLPGVSGEAIIERVNGAPIIVLSAKVSVDDKVNCLLAGANDYLTKPFYADELLARIEVQLRLNTSRDQLQSLKYKELELLPDTQILLLKHEKIRLTRTETVILKQLLLHPTQVLTKSRLLDLLVHSVGCGGGAAGESGYHNGVPVQLFHVLAGTATEGRIAACRLRRGGKRPGIPGKTNRP